MMPARAAEPVYRPILAGQRGELDALGHLDGAHAPMIAPILQLSVMDRSIVEALGRLPPGLVPALDVSAVPDAAAAEPARWGVPLMPVICLADGERRLAAHGATARAHTGRAVVRLRVGQDRAGPDATTAATERIWRYARLAPEQCDLLVDCGDVGCPADVRVVEPRVRRMLDWARRHAWRSVSVAAGGMPAALSRLPTDEPVRLGRWDWLLWQELADLGVGFGDYGVASATAVPAVAGDRLPTVRYTTDDAWWIYRWSRRGGRGDGRVADLCRTVVSTSHWPSAGAAFSWGDHEILRRARRGAGAGSTTNWLAWSTSHHLAHVLAALGQPAHDGAWHPVVAGQRGHYDDATPPPRGRTPRGGSARRAG
nr:beta family protein [Micromonospora radicis]